MPANYSLNRIAISSQQRSTQHSELTNWIVKVNVNVKVKVTLRLAVYRQSVFLGVNPE
jgi:ribosomal protein L20